MVGVGVTLWELGHQPNNNMARTKKSGAHQSTINHLEQTIFFHGNIPRSYWDVSLITTNICLLLAPQEKWGEDQNHGDEIGSQSIQTPPRHSQSDRHSQPASLRLLFAGLHARRHVQRLESKRSHDSLLSKSFLMLFSEAQVIRFMSRRWFESRSCDTGDFVPCITDVVGFRIWRHKPYPSVWNRLHVTTDQFARCQRHSGGNCDSSSAISKFGKHMH